MSFFIPNLLKLAILAYVLISLSSYKAYSIIFEDYYIPPFQSIAFGSEADFKDFFKNHGETLNVSWPGISPRSYVISVDFTLSQKNGVRVLELNGPSYPYGVTSHLLFLKFSKLQKFFKSNFIIFGGSGHRGHDELFPRIDFNSLLNESVNRFAEEFSIPLQNIYSEFQTDDIHRFTGRSQSAIFVYGSALDYFTWQQTQDYRMTFNHPGIIHVTSYKTLFALLTEVNGVSVPTTFFTSNRFRKSPGIVNDFLNKNSNDLFILKPSDQARSIGVLLVKRSELQNPTQSLLKILSNFNVWILQPYMPSDPVQDTEGHYRNPVGRFFYHLIFDGNRVRIEPLIAYQKISSYKSTEKSDIFNTSKAEFSPSEQAIEFTREQLELAVSEVNRFFKSTIRDLYQLSELDVSKIPHSESSLPIQLASLSPHEREALIESIKRYSHVEHSRRDFESNKTIITPEAFENPAYISVRGVKPSACLNYFR